VTGVVCQRIFRGDGGSKKYVIPEFAEGSKKYVIPETAAGRYPESSSTIKKILNQVQDGGSQVTCNYLFTL
jgi:uncharacterized beta-barrel protein YwiB (DUF1934 family)